MFKDGFLSIEEASKRERDKIKSRNPNCLVQYPVQYLNDCLTGIVPSELCVVGADTGVGKTEFVNQLAFHNALLGKNVYLFSLEGDEDETISRLRWRFITEEYYKNPNGRSMDYKKYLINGLEIDDLEEKAELRLREAKTLKIFNNSTRVGPDEIKRQMGLIDAADLVIIDHLQYIDNDPDKSEYAQTSSTMKLIKDLTKIKKIPIVLVSHLRKKDRFRNFPDNDDFHGSSNIAKEAETCIIIFRNKQVHTNKSDTIIRVTKCRHGSERQHMGRINFNPSKGTYDKEYTLVYPDGKDLVEFSLGDLPHWAR